MNLMEGQCTLLRRAWFGDSRFLSCTNRRARNEDRGQVMATKLEKPLRRELAVDGKPYMLTITPDGFKLVEKGRRNGIELAWKEIVSGEARLAAALNASLEESRE
jgi:hypothetical protein